MQTYNSDDSGTYTGRRLGTHTGSLRIYRSTMADDEMYSDSEDQTTRQQRVASPQGCPSPLSFPRRWQRLSAPRSVWQCDKVIRYTHNRLINKRLACACNALNCGLEGTFIVFMILPILLLKVFYQQFKYLI